MKAKHLVHEEVCSFMGCGQFGYGNEVNSLENLSTMVSMTVLPCDGGKLVTKSKAMCDQG